MLLRLQKVLAQDGCAELKCLRPQNIELAGESPWAPRPDQHSGHQLGAELQRWRARGSQSALGAGAGEALECR